MREGRGVDSSVRERERGWERERVGGREGKTERERERGRDRERRTCLKMDTRVSWFAFSCVH